MLHYVNAELNGFLRDGDKGLEIAGTENGWLALKLCTKPWWCNSFRRHSSQCVRSRSKAVGDELNRNVSHSSCNTGALLQVADGMSGLTG